MLADFGVKPYVTRLLATWCMYDTWFYWTLRHWSCLVKYCQEVIAWTSFCLLPSPASQVYNLRLSSVNASSRLGAKRGSAPPQKILRSVISKWHILVNSEVLHLNYWGYSHWHSPNQNIGGDVSPASPFPVVVDASVAPLWSYAFSSFSKNL